MLRLLHSPAGYGLLALLIFFLILVAAECAVFAPWPAYGAPAGCTVCLSQIYGHGGKSGSHYDADFVELFNRSDEPKTLVGWRLDYADVHSEDWRTIDLSPLALPPYGYALVGLKRGATGARLPAVDLADNLNLGGSDGKLQLVDGENTLIDLVGYGGAEWAEGAPAPGAAAGAALLRLDGGCRDSDDNAADFVQVQPIPHNSQSPAYPCVTAEQPPPPTATDTPLPTETPTALPTPTATETSTPMPTDTLLPVYTTQSATTAESTVAWSPEPTLAPTAPASPAETPTATPLPTPTWGPIPTPIATPAATQTAYATPDFLPSATSDPPLTVPQTPVGSGELTAQATASETPTPSPAATETGPATLTATVTPPHTPTPAATATKTPRFGTSTATWTPTRTPTPANWLTATATPAPTRHATQTPNMTATPAQGNAFTPTAVAKMTGTPAPTLPAMWSRASAPSPLQIDEVAYAGSDAEYIVLANVLDTDLALAGWLLGDAERPGDGEGIYALPDLRLAPGGLYVVARQADVFHARYDRWPDATLENSASALPQLARRRELAGGKLALNDGGDEIVLLAPSLLLADAMAFGKAEYGVLGLAGELRAAGDYTLQRVPGATFPAVADVRHRFLAAPPRPFEPRGLPLGAASQVAAVGGGYLGVWGTLGAHSNFTSGYTAPPHYLIAAAAAQGLQFVAVADTGALAPPVWIPRGMTVLPAWGWRGGNAESAVVYNDHPEPGSSSNGLSGYRGTSSGLVQWQGKDNPALNNLAALAADESRGQDIAWFFKRWRMLGGPLLPAGNAEPNLPGAVAVEPHYTGLAVREQDVAGLLDALAAGRGWMTTDPNSWLVLQAETAEGNLYWMGSWLPSAGQATVGQVMLHVAYGDLEGEMASLAIWQDGTLLEEHVLPASDGLWNVPVSLAPGTLLAAVATQADGDYAVTAPLQVLRSSGENGGGTSNTATPESKPPVNSTSPGATQPGNEHHDGGDHDSAAAAAILEPTYGQAGGAPGTVAQSKVAGLEAEVELRAVVTAPPGLFNGSIYVADLAGDGVTAGIGANVYLRQGVFPPLKEGDRVWLHGRWSSYRGEMELVLAGPQDVWKLESGPALHPLPVWAHSVCESVEGRLVTFIGTVVGWQGDSLLLVDPAHPAATPTRVTVRSSLPWKRPFVYKGEIWRVTGIVSQFARKSPWNDGYRVLPRYVEDLVRME